MLSEEEYRGFDPKVEGGGGGLKGVEASQLRGYVFTWGKAGEMAVALGLGELRSKIQSISMKADLLMLATDPQDHSSIIHRRLTSRMKSSIQSIRFIIEQRNLSKKEKNYSSSTVIRFDSMAIPYHRSTQKMDQ